MQIIDEKTRRFAVNSLFPTFFYAAFGLVLVMGIRIAVEGMKISCGATLIASQITDTIEYGSGAVPAASTARPASAAAALAGAAASLGASSATPPPDHVDKQTHPYDEQVRVLDEEGQPIAGMPYHITDESRNVYKGITDSDGCCQRIHTENVESLAILTGASALEKWR